MSSLKYWVWLSSKNDINPRIKNNLIDAFGDPKEVFFADRQKLYDRCQLSDSVLEKLSDKDLKNTNEILANCNRDNISIITIGDTVYPERLRNIFDPPILLYVKGQLPSIDEEAVIGMVGTRKATTYGLKMGRKISYEITRSGGLVVTGLAGGVDSACAEGALRAGGSCIGVLGCGINIVYPSWNTDIYNDVQTAGALISEYPPGTPPYGKNFPIRNRIISGLSVGVTVIEAPRNSGALITARDALEQGREVFAIPGNADAPNCYGSNTLIREGAQLVLDGFQVIEEFQERFPYKVVKENQSKLDVPFENLEDSENTEKLSKVSKYTNNSPNPLEDTRKFVSFRTKTLKNRIDKKPKREYIDLEKQLEDLSENQLKIISVIEQKSMHVDDIIDKTELSAQIVLSELTILQIRGFVTQESGKRFSLNIKKK